MGTITSFPITTENITDKPVASALTGTEVVEIVQSGANKQLTIGSAIEQNYDQGSWTPIFNFVTVSYTNQIGNYVKIGNYVHCYYQIVFTGLDIADTSSITVGGAPFTVIDYSVNGNGFETANTERLLCGAEDNDRVRFYKTNDTSGFSTQVQYNEYFNSASGTFEGNYTYITS